MTIPNILIIGAGSVGAFAAAVMARKQLGTIYLYDIVEDLAVGRAIDINQASPYLYTDTKVIGCNSLDDVPDADVVVITAGHARHAGMTRLDLLNRNREVMDNLGNLIITSFPQAKILVVTNPVDVLAWYLKHTWPEMNVFGLGCSLDTMRFRYFIAEAVGGSVDCSRGMVIGTHNDDMIPLVNHATVGGVPLRHIMDKTTIDKVVQRTRSAGTTITQKLKVHSGFYAAAHVVTQIVESIVFNRLGTFPLSVFCNGEYGYDGINLALPSVVGQDGINRVLEIDLDEEEHTALNICASAMSEITHSLA
ncbi:MAG TPA: malate dehydrogenase [Deltaproteobacteria bacterium]|nr:malate dehydrogenase [Deltaproteobacteria bacterium]